MPLRKSPRLDIAVLPGRGALLYLRVVDEPNRKEMRRRNIKYMPVVEAGKLVGIVTLKDIIKYLEFRINYLTFK